jgi:murein hydrolase activator
MVKFISATLALILFCTAVSAQTREELERQRAQYKKELEQTEKMLNENKSRTKENFVQWKLINEKVNIQDKIINNINKDINLLDNSMIGIQRDINRYNRLLDTLKQEYAKSMVYAYKNRSNYDFLNFIFSAGSFNDAIKRIAYLKSYRSYREMQGENILRTQDLRKQRIEEMAGTRQKKNMVLSEKDKEMAKLETQKQEKDKILNSLKKQGKELSVQLAAKKKQYAKVTNAINAAIKKASEDARKLAIKRAAEEERRNAAENPTVKNNNSGVKTPVITKTPKEPAKAPESVLLNAENRVLNANFTNNRGALPWPVDKGYILLHFGKNQMGEKTDIVVSGISVATDVGNPVKAVFDGVVSSIVYIEEMQVVILQHGKYFSTYSNISGVSVQRGQQVKMGQTLGKAMANLEGVGAVDFYISDEKGNQDPERWLRKR